MMKRARSGSKSDSKVHESKRTKTLSRVAPSRPKRKVRLDELGWKTVSVPDRLEDFEGFYGLEEIEDVTIARDPATGHISFETTKTAEEVERDIEVARRCREEEADRLEKTIFGREVQMKEEHHNEDDDESAWEGFEDSEEDGPVAETKVTNNEFTSKSKESISAHQDSKNKNFRDATVSKTQADQTLATPISTTSSNEYEEQVLYEASSDEYDSHIGGAFAVLTDRVEDENKEADMSGWSSLEVCEELQDSLAKLNFFRPTPIQVSAIPEIMAGRDVIGKATTGSGKTLAFGIPILQSFIASSPASKGDGKPLALIISPTRELAHQITAHLTELCAKGRFEVPSITSVTGGLSVQKQRRQLEKTDIVVGTPGRLWEVITNGQGLIARLKQIRFLVIDEADRLLSEGHYQELKEILKVLNQNDEADGPSEARTSLDAPRQTLVFSATFERELQRGLASRTKTGRDSVHEQESVGYLLKKVNFREERPVFIDVNPNSQMAGKLQEGLVECAGPEKDLYLYSLLLFSMNKRALVFKNSISAVRRLTPFLQNLALPALPLHSTMPQKSRLRSVERFKDRPGSILVATDVAARGLDIPQVELVIHYHLPRAADTYIHRSGRTARAEAPGISILICAPKEVAGVRRLVAKVHGRTRQQQKTRTPNAKTHFIRTLDLDRRVVSRLKARVTISKTLADAVIAKEKKHDEINVMRQAAEDLGVEYDSEELDRASKGKRGRGNARKQKERMARTMTRAEAQALRAELSDLLSRRINTGVSARYLTSGGIDVHALLMAEAGGGEGGKNALFLGTVDDALEILM